MSLTLIEAFSRTTRGRIVELLRCEPMTAPELAAELGLTGKAVRGHLALLLRDGFVRQRGRRRGAGAGKPAVLYDFNPAAEMMFSAAYGPALHAVLSVLERITPTRRRSRAFALVGAELARSFSRVGNRAQSPAGAVAAVLKHLGGIVDIERSNGEILVRACGCPMSSVVQAHPGVCTAMESALRGIASPNVRECCDKATPACCFALPARTSRTGVASRRSGAARR
jgi:predicted ArsR family transcriptional regulator